MAQNCFRHLGYNSFRQVDELTIPEYNALMEAVQLRHIDKLRDIHLQAWLVMKAGAKKPAGKNKMKLVFPQFDKFFDYKKVLAEFKASKHKETDRISAVGKLLSDMEEK